MHDGSDAAPMRIAHRRIDWLRLTRFRFAAVGAIVCTRRVTPQDSVGLYLPTRPAWPREGEWRADDRQGGRANDRAACRSFRGAPADMATRGSEGEYDPCSREARFVGPSFSGTVYFSKSNLLACFFLWRTCFQTAVESFPLIKISSDFNEPV